MNGPDGPSPDPAEPEAEAEPERAGSIVGPVVGAVVGVPILLFGIAGLLYDADRTHPLDATRWVVGAAVVHDFVALPLLLLLTTLLTRPLPAWARPAVRAGLAVSAILTLVAWPEAAGYGRDPTIPSLLPRNEAAGLVAYLVVVWAAVGAFLVRRRRLRSPRL